LDFFLSDLALRASLKQRRTRFNVGSKEWNRTPPSLIFSAKDEFTRSIEKEIRQ
jgi:hypothetical protein